jgi:outer membrane receptor protein involved in Fe transport
MRKTCFEIARYASVLLGACLILAVPTQADFSTEAIEFDIEAQSLSGALRDIARQAKVQLVYVPADIMGRHSSGLRGTYDPIDALALLLEDTNLVAQQIGDHTISITSATPVDPEPDDKTREYLESRAPVVEELIVTASRREKSLLELPISVSVVSLSELNARNVRDTNEILDWLPSTNLTSTSLQFNDIVIRGLANTGSGGHTFDFLLDDAAMVGESFASSPVLLDLERLELLKGPQGTLYGENSLSGLLRLISVRPRFNKFEGSIGINAWGTEKGDDSWHGEAIVNIPLVADALAARLAISHEDRGGFVDIYSTTPITLLPDTLVKKNANSVERTAYRAAINWQAYDRLSVYLTARQQSLTTLWSPFETMLRIPSGGDDLRPAGDFLLTPPNHEYTREPVNDEKWMTLEARYAFEGVTLISTTAMYDTDNGYAFPSIAPLPTGDQITLIDARTEQTNRSQELRLVSRDDDSFEWVAGAYWREHEYSSRIESERPSFLLNAHSEQQVKRTQKALFANIMYKPAERLALEFGIRLFREDFEVGTQFEGEIAGTPLPTDTRNGSDTRDVSAPRFTMSYKLSDATFVYGSIAKGFRGGVANINPGLPEGLRSAGPDTNYAYEIGAKGRWLDNMLMGSAAIFYNDWRDIHVRTSEVFNGETVFFTTNGESAHTAGMEVEFVWLPADMITLSMRAHYMDTRLDSTIRGLSITATTVKEGVELPAAPKYALALTVDFNRPLTSDWAAYARIDLLARAGSFSNLTNEPITKSDSYQLGNIRLGVQSDRWDVSLFAHNAWNERAHTGHRRNFVSPDVGQADIIAPRRMGLAIRRRF